MIIVLVSSAVAVVALVAWFSVRQFAEQGKHAGSGAGALTVHQLLAQARAEATRGGRHRLREPENRGDPFDDSVTQVLPRAEAGLPFDDTAAMARHPWTLRRILAELQRL
ncbi:hypothetical protein LZ318_08315 [Saccharopolyspora indica]|uniref:hypothetical protein n=1 Tax=Saccharopolyspora indica TaxID=1229659 RepID=UPI0022EA2730|nr:hypothetical protein [Saccharopolyspora indica]MDA3649640.1 hypothetical protein [Saccharopolyspora indica]